MGVTIVIARDWGRSFASHADFYEQVYGQHVTAVHRIGSGSAAVIDATEPPGDWSDAPTPDITIACLMSERVGFSFDLGAGRFTGMKQKLDAVLIAPGVGSSIQIHGDHSVRCVSIPYAWATTMAGGAGKGLPTDGDFGHLHTCLIRDMRLRSALDLVWREAQTTPHGGALYSDALLLQLLGLLLRMTASQPAHKIRGGLAPWQVRRVGDYLEDRLAEDVSLAELAALLDLSTFHLCRAFKQSTGLPPHRWRHQRRMERARELLEGTNDPITEIAAAVGYDDPSRLAAGFRKAFGVTPTQYRRERRS